MQGGHDTYHIKYTRSQTVQYIIDFTCKWSHQFAQTLKRSEKNSRYVQQQSNILILYGIYHYNFPGFVLPVCLPPADFSPRTAAGNKSAIAAGWGFTETGSTSDRIKHVKLPLLDNTQCSQIYSGNIVSEQVNSFRFMHCDSCQLI